MPMRVALIPLDGHLSSAAERAFLEELLARVGDALAGEERYRAEADEDSLIWHLPEDAFRQLLARHPELDDYFSSALGARVRALGRDRRLRRLGVTSASAGDGRSSVALGLAHALAEGDRRRVLLEADGGDDRRQHHQGEKVEVPVGARLDAIDEGDPVVAVDLRHVPLDGPLDNGAKAVSDG